MQPAAGESQQRGGVAVWDGGSHAPLPRRANPGSLSTLIRKFGNVFWAQATSWSRGRPGVFIRRRRWSRSLRVNFHSNGLARAS